MPSGFLRTSSTVRGGVITMEKRPVSRLVSLRAPPSKIRSSQRTWNELSEARTTLVTSTATVSRPTLAKGSLSRAYSLSVTAARSVTKS